MKHIKNNLWFYIIIFILVTINVVLIITDFDINNDVTQAAIITLTISTMANIIITIINSYNNNKNEEINRNNSIKLKELENADRKEIIKLENDLIIEKEKELYKLKLSEHIGNKSDLRKEIAINELSSILDKTDELILEFFLDYRNNGDSYYNEKNCIDIVNKVGNFRRELYSLTLIYKKITKKGVKFTNICIVIQKELKELHKTELFTKENDKNKKIVVDIYYPILNRLANRVGKDMKNEIYEITREYYCID